MEPVTIALICAAAFGAVVALSAFVRQLLVSRDKNLNDEAQRKAITQEAGELEKMREQMQNNKRFDSHYQVLGSNKDAIIYLDNKIEDILKKKSLLVERYAQVSLKESNAIVSGGVSPDRKESLDKLKEEIDQEIKFYNSELEHLQERRKSLWDSHADLQDYLLQQEKTRNENLDNLYKQHTGLLEKIYIRHIDDSEHIAKQSIDAGSNAFKMMILAPIQFLLQYFNISTGIALDQSKWETNSRDEVEDTEGDINDQDKSDDEVNSDTDSNNDPESNDSDKDESNENNDSETDSKFMFA
ncbi:hypothetical protein [Legionella waltersii]|uniref:Uncharacterized protein n=1 Tax=Legionella waltersii TaxID=66969 RepID=A0A0W1ANI0_9GAMM|nr:hypothetical protein [Legionella waltersii]KTD82889.1 hypothetical protein Lwal_0367 [Legionella waltersii]SNV02108.1 Uncharacterised protein [Legionella waltersii]